ALALGPKRLRLRSLRSGALPNSPGSRRATPPGGSHARARVRFQASYSVSEPRRTKTPAALDRGPGAPAPDPENDRPVTVYPRPVPAAAVYARDRCSDDGKGRLGIGRLSLPRRADDWSPR